MAKKTITSLLNNIKKEVDGAYEGIEEYTHTLEDTWVIYNHLEKIEEILKQLKGMI